MVNLMRLFLMLFFSCGSFVRRVLYAARMLSQSCSSVMASVPKGSLMVRSFFVWILARVLSRVAKGSRGAVVGMTQPAFGLGIFPFGPRTFPKVAAMLVIRSA